MNTHSPTFSIKQFRWASEFGGPKKHGVRIDRERGWIFVPNDELLALANALADHIERNRNA